MLQRFITKQTKHHKEDNVMYESKSCLELELT